MSDPNRIAYQQTVEHRTLAPLIAARESARNNVGLQQANAQTAYGRHAYQQALQPNQTLSPFNDSGYVNRATDSLLNVARLDGRMSRIQEIIAGASVRELIAPNLEFDPWRAEHMARTVQDGIAQASHLTRPRARARFADGLSAIAASEYDGSPLQPYPDHEARRALQLRSQGWFSWAIGSLLDKL